jgi:hypothetical protein
VVKQLRCEVVEPNLHGLEKIKRQPSPLLLKASLYIASSTDESMTYFTFSVHFLTISNLIYLFTSAVHL